MLSNGTTSSRAGRVQPERRAAGAAARAGAGGAGGRGRCRRRGRRRGPARAPGRRGAGARRARRSLGGGVEDVLAGDAAAGAGAADRRRVEAALGHEPAHDRRRRARPAAVVGRRAPGAGAAAGSGAPVRRGRRCGAGSARRRRGRRCRLGLAARAAGAAPARARLGPRAAGRAAPVRARRRRRGAAAGAGGGVAAASPSTARRVPTSTVSPSGTRISVTHAGDGRGHLGVDLVGGDLEQRLVGLDVVADLLEPAGDRAFGDRLPQLGHRHVHMRTPRRVGRLARRV